MSGDMPPEQARPRDRPEEPCRAPWHGPWLRPKRIILVLVGLFVLAQLVPVWLLQTNPPVTGQPAWDSARTAALVRNACYDCHSNATTWALV